MPSKSQCAQPHPRDVPPKTRSTPEATLVVDLVSFTLRLVFTSFLTPASFQEETLMFSSLSVMDQAEHTFYTTFQDHQYKVFRRYVHECAPARTSAQPSSVPRRCT